MRLRKSSGKVLDLSMEEGSGTTAYDASRYGNDGAINGGVEWVENGMRFDGSSGYLDCGNDQSLDFNAAGDSSYGVWCRLDQLPSVKGDNMYAFSKKAVGAGYYFGIDKWTDVLEVTNPNGWGSVLGNTTIAIDEWYYLNCVYSNQTISFYVNGVPDGGGAAGVFVSLAASDVYIGSNETGNFHHINGSIDAVKIYNRALTPLEIKHDYDATKYKYL